MVAAIAPLLFRVCQRSPAHPPAAGWLQAHCSLPAPPNIPSLCHLRQAIAII